MNAKYTPRLTPKAHQKKAVELMVANDMANFDDQGLGKCKQAYDTAASLIQSKEIDLMVMVSKASLRENFLKELSGDAHQLIGKIVGGNKVERKKVYRFLGYHVLILSYETVVTDIELLKRVFEKNRVLFCLDEAHYIKNPGAKRSKACLELAELASRKAIFTGTPIPNDLEDIYTQLRFMGQEVGNSLEEFSARFGDIEEFREFLHARMIRRTKRKVTSLKIPGKKYNYISVKLSEEEQRIYDKAANEMLLVFKDKFKKEQSVPINNVLTQLLRLTQIASNPGAALPSYSGKVSKLDRLDELLEDLVEKKDEKVVIWTSYRKNIGELKKRYSKYGVVELIGGIGKDGLSENARKFQEDPSTKVLLAIPACAREGFTLTKACKAIYLDRNFSLLDWVQSQDRIHRISQNRECEIIVLQSEDTIDARINDVLDRKDHLQKYLLGDIEEYDGREKVELDDLENIVTPRGGNE